MTKIITTIGPASFNPETLEFYKSHGVAIARLNFSHGSSEKHIEMANTCRSYGMEILVDTAGPKVLLGSLVTNTTIETGHLIRFELQDTTKSYPYNEVINGEEHLVIPCQFNMHDFVEVGALVLIDDGKLSLVTDEVTETGVIATVTFGGLVKSNKGVNLPGTNVNIPFLVARDLELIAAVVPVVKPEWIAPSFVKTIEDIKTLTDFLETLEGVGVSKGYMPKICTKVEMDEAITNFDSILEVSDMIMIARGDLAVETTPAHIMVPGLQDMMAEKCQAAGKPFIVATQILESMMESPVPTRAEVSDLYRAVKYNKADYVMLSGESAAGAFPKECVDLMWTMINL
jgi:pyruvate kinase